MDDTKTNKTSLPRKIKTLFTSAKHFKARSVKNFIIGGYQKSKINIADMKNACSSCGEHFAIYKAKNGLFCYQKTCKELRQY